MPDDLHSRLDRIEEKLDSLLTYHIKTDPQILNAIGALFHELLGRTLGIDDGHPDGIRWLDGPIVTLVSETADQNWKQL